MDTVFFKDFDLIDNKNALVDLSAMGLVRVVLRQDSVTRTGFLSSNTSIGTVSDIYLKDDIIVKGFDSVYGLVINPDGDDYLIKKGMITMPDDWSDFDHQNR